MSSDSMASKSSSSELSAQKRPACKARTPVKATLQMRLFDASSSVACLKARGNGSLSWWVGKVLNDAKISFGRSEASYQ